MYGSVSPKDISNYFKDENILISPSNINLTSPIKKTGIYEVKIKLHADVLINIFINVAISKESAIEQKKTSLDVKQKKENEIIKTSDEGDTAIYQTNDEVTNAKENFNTNNETSINS